MNGLAVAAEALPFLAALTTLAVLLFAAAAWRGRWPLWLAGWGVILLALVVTFFFRDPPRPDTPGQRSSAAGVVEHPEQRPGVFEPARIAFNGQHRSSP